MKTFTCEQTVTAATNIIYVAIVIVFEIKQQYYNKTITITKTRTVTITITRNDNKNSRKKFDKAQHLHGWRSIEENILSLAFTLLNITKSAN